MIKEAAQTPLQDPAEMSYEAAIKELEHVINNLETGQVPLEDAIKAYERGAQLRHRCETLLSQAKMKVQEVMATADGEFVTQQSELESLLGDA